MKQAFRPFVYLFACSLFASTLFGQGALLSPWTNAQYTNAAGLPLSAGRVYTCVAGTSCPGNPIPTYNSSNGFTQNTNPVVLGSDGRASIWLTPGVSYKVVVTDALGSVQTTVDNVMGAITTQSSSGGNPGSPASSIQWNNGSNGFGGSPNLTWNNGTQVLGVTGTAGQAGVQLYQGYFQSLGGYLSTFSGGGAWNAFNSGTDGAALRGYTTQQTVNNNAGGYLDIVPITYNPYNGATCLDTQGNVVRQPLPLNGLTNFGSTDAILWAGTSPSMPAGGSCGVPLPTGITTGLNLNTFMYARGGFITDNANYNAVQAVNGGFQAKLGFTAGQAFYPGDLTTCSSLGNPGPGFGGWGYAGGTNYCWWNDVNSTWNTINLAASSGGTGCTLGSTATGQIIFNLSGACTSSNNLLWNNSTQVLTVAATSNTSMAIQASVGYILGNGGLSSGTCGGASLGTSLLNCVQTGAFGGMTAGFGFFTPQALYPGPNTSSGTLNNPGGGYGGLAYKGGSVYWYYNSAGAAWGQVDFATSGSGCTLGGSSTTQVIYNSAGACAGSANLIWNNATQTLGVTSTSLTTGVGFQVNNGYILSAGGLSAGACATFNCIQTVSGGMQTLSLTAHNYVQLGNYTSGGVGTAPPITSGDAYAQGALAYDRFGSVGGVGGNLRVFDGANWNVVGGGGSPATPTGGIQYNGGSGFAATTNLTWNNSTQALSIGGISGTQGVILNGGAYFQSNGTAGGFNAPNATATNAIQAPAGGVTAKYLVTNDSLFINEEGQPATAPGGQVRLYADSSSHTLRYSENGAGYVTIATGGISSLNGISSGAINIVGTSNEITVTPAAPSIILSTPQQIGTSSAVNFASVTTTGTHQSSASGASIGFSLANSNFLVNGNGVVSGLAFNSNSPTGKISNTANTAFDSITTVGGYNANASGTAAGNAYSVNGSGVINLAGAFIGSSVTTGGGITATGGFQSPSTSSSIIFVGASGNFYNRTIGASSGLSCAAVNDGWTALASDGFIVVCRGGARFRAAIASF